MQNCRFHANQRQVNRVAAAFIFVVARCIIFAYIFLHISPRAQASSGPEPLLESESLPWNSPGRYPSPASLPKSALREWSGVQVAPLASESESRRPALAKTLFLAQGVSSMACLDCPNEPEPGGAVQAEPKYWQSLTQFSNWDLTEIGFGMHVGEPTGLAARFIFANSKALAVQSGWSFRGLSGFHTSADLLLYVFDAFDLPKIELDSYMGPGLSIKVWENDRLQWISADQVKRVRARSESFGMRLPIGLSLYMLRPAFELYCELAPAMTLVPATEFSFDFGAGLLLRFGM